MSRPTTEPGAGATTAAGSSGPHAHPHAHDHEHAHPRGPPSRLTPAERKAELRSLLGALSVTVTVMFAEAIGGWWSGSLSLQADAGHMLTDASSLVLSVLALWFASRPADPKRTYGYYRLEILAALANGVVLLLLAFFIVWEAIGRVKKPEPVHAPAMLAIDATGLVANLVGVWLLHRRTHSLNVRGAYLHLLGDTLSSIGVVVAAGLVWWTGLSVLDPLVSVAIAVVVVLGALRLLREAVDVLLEAVPQHLDLAEVLHELEDVSGVGRIHDLHVWTISSGLYALSAHVVVESCDLGRNDEILAQLRRRLSERFGIDHATLQIETPAHCREMPVSH